MFCENISVGKANKVLFDENHQNQLVAYPPSLRGRIPPTERGYLWAG